MPTKNFVFQDGTVRSFYYTDGNMQNNPDAEDYGASLLRLSDSDIQAQEFPEVDDSGNLLNPLMSVYCQLVE